MHTYITNEIKEYVNRIAIDGKIGTSTYFKGISSADEDRITSLLLQAIPSSELPSINSLDMHNGLTLLIARFIARNDEYSLSELGNYIKHLYIDHFKEKIKTLVDDALNDRELV